MENLTLFLGLAAGALTTIAFIPQVVKIYVSKSARDVSILTFAFFTLGIFLWLIYGLLIREAPIIVANLISLVLALMIVAMKIRYR